MYNNAYYYYSNSNYKNKAFNHNYLHTIIVTDINNFSEHN